MFNPISSKNYADFNLCILSLSCGENFRKEKKINKQYLLLLRRHTIHSLGKMLEIRSLGLEPA